MIQVAIYLLIGAAIALYASIQNTKYEEVNSDKEKISAKKGIFLLINLLWPVYITLWISLMFVGRKKDDE